MRKATSNDADVALCVAPAHRWGIADAGSVPSQTCQSSMEGENHLQFGHALFTIAPFGSTTSPLCASKSPQA
jgi:hypothetical protein